MCDLDYGVEHAFDASGLSAADIKKQVAALAEAGNALPKRDPNAPMVPPADQ